MKLEGKVAIVTAAGRGIGRGITLCLAEEGADIVINSYSEETTARTASDVRLLGRRVLAIAGDITEADTISQVIHDTIDTFGRIDILVNNVGGGSKTRREPGSGLLGRKQTGWDVTYEQNLRASVLMCEAVAPHLMEQKSGKIVNIGSVDGRYTPSVNGLAYSVLLCHEGWLAQLHPVISRGTWSLQNINVNCVCPGIVPTDVWKGISKRFVENVPELKGQDPEDFFAGIAQSKYPDIFASIPLRRLSTVEDIGRAVVFLVSEDSRNITGQALNVDGGMVKSR